MQQFIAQIINGLMVGGLYALVAVSFALIFGVLRVVYLTHGQVMMVGAYIGLFVVTATGNILLALLGALVVGGLLGGVLERVTVRPLLGQHHLMPLVTTISAGVILEEVVRLSYHGGEVVSYPAQTLEAIPSFGHGLIRVSPVQLLVLAVAAALVVALGIVIKSTWYGRVVRAVAESPETSQMLGVNVSRVSLITFVLSSALTALAGVLFGLVYASFDPYFGETIGLKALVVVLVGGLGSLTGAAVGGVILGLVEALAAGYLASSYQDAFAFGLLVLVLLIRPAGLLGTTQNVRSA